MSERPTAHADRKPGEKPKTVRERVSGHMSRIFTLPADMTEDDAKAFFKNGIMEVRR
jgi:HSP20 family molecular chaperone IbpA